MIMTQAQMKPYKAYKVTIKGLTHTLMVDGDGQLYKLVGKDKATHMQSKYKPVNSLKHPHEMVEA